MNDRSVAITERRPRGLRLRRPGFYTLVTASMLPWGLPSLGNPYLADPKTGS